KGNKGNSIFSYQLTVISQQPVRCKNFAPLRLCVKQTRYQPTRNYFKKVTKVTLFPLFSINYFLLKAKVGGLRGPINISKSYRLTAKGYRL
ncbi:MAG: hypothetical protein LBQ74_02745, partial [Prevotella sp.]|uniref:hypothetical protein n=1 Tax=Dysgonomonas sp. UBA7710 TaxID=1946428 RepID=UPI0025C3805E